MTTTDQTNGLQTGVWTADPAHSTIEFRVRHLGLSTVRGRFTDFTADRAGFSAASEISRKDFGIEFNVPLDGGGLLMGDKVKIELDMQLVSPQ